MHIHRHTCPPAHLHWHACTRIITYSHTHTTNTSTPIRPIRPCVRVPMYTHVPPMYPCAHAHIHVITHVAHAARWHTTIQPRTRCTHAHTHGMPHTVHTCPITLAHICMRQNMVHTPTHPCDHAAMRTNTMAHMDYHTACTYPGHPGTLAPWHPGTHAHMHTCTHARGSFCAPHTLACVIR